MPDIMYQERYTSLKVDIKSYNCFGSDFTLLLGMTEAFINFITNHNQRFSTLLSCVSMYNMCYFLVGAKVCMEVSLWWGGSFLVSIPRTNPEAPLRRIFEGSLCVSLPCEWSKLCFIQLFFDRWFGTMKLHDRTDLPSVLLVYDCTAKLLCK